MLVSDPMADSRKTGRPPHEVETVEFKITTTRIVVEDLKRLAQGGYYGRSHNETAEQLVRERLRQLLGEKEFRRVLRPEVKAKDD